MTASTTTSSYGVRSSVAPLQRVAVRRPLTGGPDVVAQYEAAHWQTPDLDRLATLILLGGHLVLTYTRFGRYVYMVGGNREAAEYSGLNVKLILGSVMVISAVCAGIGGTGYGAAGPLAARLLPGTA